MSRSFSNVKLVIDGFSAALNRTSRSYSAAASQGVVKRSGEKLMKEGGKPEASPWVPDPVTGYYRPENRAAEISVAELREMLLKQKITKP